MRGQFSPISYIGVPASSPPVNVYDPTLLCSVMDAKVVECFSKKVSSAGWAAVGAALTSVPC
jgi:hypothetical protein